GICERRFRGGKIRRVEERASGRRPGADRMGYHAADLPPSHGEEHRARTSPRWE
ncbi:hypothetical protein HAX54_051491, partial [Datura stramonium]|nr:hypothetical protein [Datura stramonium]